MDSSISPTSSTSGSVVVDEPVDNRVQEPVGALVHAPVEVPSHGVYRLVGLVVDGDEVALTDEDVDLVGGHAVTLQVPRREPRQEEAVGVDVEFRP